MYNSIPALILGFHGCDREIGEKVLSGELKHLRDSRNRYDWLGNGIYFWEGNHTRALEYANECANRKNYNINEPFVIGAVIDSGRCLNLLDSKYLRILKASYGLLVRLIENAKDGDVAPNFSVPKSLPENRPIGQQGDLLLRNLDCAVIEVAHAYNTMTSKLPFDSVRAVFTEGGELYPNAGFKEKSHIQICVRNPNCIKGYFRPITQNKKYHIP